MQGIVISVKGGPRTERDLQKLALLTIFLSISVLPTYLYSSIASGSPLVWLVSVLAVGLIFLGLFVIPPALALTVIAYRGYE